MKTLLLSLILLFTHAMKISAQNDPGNIQIACDHVAISVTDLEESEEFYRDVIGLRQIPEPFGVGRHAWFDIGHGELHVIRAAEERTEHPRTNHLCFSVSNMDAFIERIASYGIEFTDAAGNVGQINHRPDGVQQIYITDPDGYWIEINDAM